MGRGQPPWTFLSGGGLLGKNLLLTSLVERRGNFPSQLPMSGRGNDDGRGGSGSSSQRDERPSLPRNRHIPPPPEARPMSGGEVSSSSTTKERTYKAPPPDMSK
eukprot:3767275-Amphidinium_carterae.1